ncbi:uncharacterized protein [Physcomitrium patens]|uniref:uncharacterized protein isoform X1 n=1 Tax=Physcomitrium patens TaxID=3218 RepID=UPI000D1739B9|nr:uncharacterized protein LOC112290270 isoform X2 [Physcomitrium patens]|eukprot:XP_024392166.1 uncharacterized protein LOC112290270 isoform X2 [Physcomitrella patens]
MRAKQGGGGGILNPTLQLSCNSQWAVPKKQVIIDTDSYTVFVQGPNHQREESSTTTFSGEAILESKIYISVKQIEAMIMLTIATKHAEIQQEFHSKGFIDMIQSTSICNRSG